MAVYYSFHYARDAWRVQEVVNMGVIEGQPLLNSQEWEAVKKKGDTAIQKWIEDNMKHKNAVVVLVGAQTANRRWVKYEITKAWDEKRPLVGVRIHGLADSLGNTDSVGDNPFDKVKLKNGLTVANYVDLYNPAGATSRQVYNAIRTNLSVLVSGAKKRN